MTRLVHLSDLHFGAHDDRLVEAVEAEVDGLKPDLVVISGDFTQRARTEQFREACKFLERLRDSGHEVLAVPGNHDVPLYDVLRRFLSPLTRYRRFIDESLCPFIELPGIAVLKVAVTVLAVLISVAPAAGVLLTTVGAVVSDPPLVLNTTSTQ